MATTKKRLADLEKAVNPETDQAAAVILYDAETGKQLNTPPPGARVLVYLPDNGRDKLAETGGK